MLKVSRTLKEAAWKVSQAVTEWQNEYGRDPTLEELSRKQGSPGGDHTVHWKLIRMWIPFTGGFRK